LGSRFKTLETVLIETPDRRATSWIVIFELKSAPRSADSSGLAGNKP